MSPPHGHRTAEPIAASDDPARQATMFGTLVHLWPFIWPGDRFDLKMRVLWAVVLLLLAKLVTMTVPFTFKWAVDGLTGRGQCPRCARQLDAVADRLAADHDRELRR